MMLYSTMFRRAIALHLPLACVRAHSTMSSVSYTLDRSLFNKELYAQIRQLWFPGLTPNDTSAGKEALQKWFGIGLSQEQKDSFDAQCKAVSIAALESIGPQRVHLPLFVSHEQEVKHATDIAAPLLEEVKAAQLQDESGNGGTERLLTLILLLDQMPRNIYRTKPTLPLVYNHYDRLSYALLRSAMRLSPSPVANTFYKRRPLYMTWILMPLLHSENMASHVLWDKLTKESEALVKEEGDEEALAFTGSSRQSEEKHLEPLRKFGRYPHRNECLGRESTAAEVEWLKTGDTFGVNREKGREKGIVRDEL